MRPICYLWTATFSEMSLEMACGGERNIQFTGNSSGRRSCSQHCLNTGNICGIVLCDETEHFKTDSHCERLYNVRCLIITLVPPTHVRWMDYLGSFYTEFNKFVTRTRAFYAHRRRLGSFTSHAILWCHGLPGQTLANVIYAIASYLFCFSGKYTDGCL